MRQITNIVFDLDGTLTDSRLGITRSWAHALEKLGYEPPSLQALEQCIGPPTREVARQLLGTQDAALVERAVACYRERFATIGLFENEVYLGIPELLVQLTAAGCALYVCTSKPHVYATQIAYHFGFSASLRAVYGPELDGTRGEKTELLSHLLARERFMAESAVMVGDRRHDVEAARHVGMRNIGVLYGFGSRQELATAGAEQLCASVGDLAAALHALP
jgi:phosphoglycolate phosphatase